MGRRFGCGFTVLELCVSTAVSLVLVLTVAALLTGGNRAWRRTYDSASSKVKQDALDTMIAFGSVGRRSNASNVEPASCVLYDMSGDTLTPALPKTTNVVFGDAVEFRYWDVPLSQELLKIKATAYALFYLDADELKVDYGPYPPGAAPKGGGSRNTSGVTTKVLAENASVSEGAGGAFSRTFSATGASASGTGERSVRISVTLTGPVDNETISVITATLMRNTWPPW
jgi:hypothetical protein